MSLIKNKSETLHLFSATIVEDIRIHDTPMTSSRDRKVTEVPSCRRRVHLSRMAKFVGQSRYSSRKLTTVS